MKRTQIVMILFLCYMLVWVPIEVPISISSDIQLSTPTNFDAKRMMSSSLELNAQTGTLDPVVVEHFGAASGVQPYTISRTDVEPTPRSEAFMPAGAQGNIQSVDCSGGYFLVGVGGSTDFGSSQGTISLWIKWDTTAPHGRFWGQAFDFETRWSSNRLTLDWGSDNTFFGIKSDWIPNHWYFLAITWDDSSNHIAVYWGDEDTEPMEDSSTSSWMGTVVGFHSENDIMNSAGRSNTQVDGHVDDFRYFSVERNLEELRSDYNTVLTGMETGLTHYYQFEDDLTDSSNDQDLVPVGSSSFSYDVFAVTGGWRAEQVEVNIRDLNRLYALNGTFESGNPGVNVDWFGDGTYYADGWLAQREALFFEGRQRTSYIDTGSKYLILENEGYEVTFPNGYRHYNGTRIYWYQTVNNIELVEDFEFSMNYLYQRGPIGTNFRNIFEFSFEVLNGTSVLWNWSIDPTNITQRGIWYSSNPIGLSIPNAPTQFEVRISLKVNTSSNYIQIPETDTDLDGDSANGQFLTFLIDDVSFISLHPPAPEEVALNITISPIGTFPIIGTAGQGLLLLNHSFWDQASIPFSFSSNTSVSFEHTAKISKMTLSSLSKNSTNLERNGVAYTIELEKNAEFSLYTYIKSYPEATGLGITIHYPSDWNDPRVENPLGQDISHEVIVGSGLLTVPSGLADSAGWWRINLEGPNYADVVMTQKQNDSDLSWLDASTFNNGDRIRCRADLGSGSSSVSNVTDVEVAWYLPTGSIWLEEILSNFGGPSVISGGGKLGPVNASVGEWLVSVSWSNGTEVGYGSSIFDLYHRFTFFAQTPNFEIEPSDEFTVAVVLYDQDNGNTVLSD
ncbi:MAG: hypothetical protein ACFFBL_13055, partial [Promethearchaeota archaeon]